MGAFDDYTALKATLAGYLHRSDLNSTANGVGVDNVVSAWITLFEAEANARLRLRTMESDESLTMTVGSRSVNLPSGYLEPLGLWITLSANTEPLDLSDRYVPIEQLPRGVTSGQPGYWSIDGTTIKFDYLADQAYPLTFRMLKSFALSSTSTTNWLLTNFPNLYLYGSLRHAPAYMLKAQDKPLWDAYVQDALMTLEEQQARTNALATMRVDPALQSRSFFNIYRG